MEFVRHSLCNDVLGAPPGVPIEECRALPICRAEGNGEVGVMGVPYVVSFWKPNAAELKLIVAGHPVVLFVTGHTHAPLMLGVANSKE